MKQIPKPEFCQDQRDIGCYIITLAQVVVMKGTHLLSSLGDGLDQIILLIFSHGTRFKKHRFCPLNTSYVPAFRFSTTFHLYGVI